jgi:hypothetical protein
MNLCKVGFVIRQHAQEIADFYVLTAVVMKIFVSWHNAAYSLLQAGFLIRFHF